MRLIDADALIEAMDKRYNEKKDIVPNNLAEGFMQMEKLIKEQPTAYDIEKVVDVVREDCYSMGFDESQTEIIIEDVRKGGVE